MDHGRNINVHLTIHVLISTQRQIKIHSVAEYIDSLIARHLQRQHSTAPAQPQAVEWSAIRIRGSIERNALPLFPDDPAQTQVSQGQGQDNL